MFSQFHEWNFIHLVRFHETLKAVWKSLKVTCTANFYLICIPKKDLAKDHLCMSNMGFYIFLY
jgi:hypothetical protein